MNKKEILSTCYICGKKFEKFNSCSKHVINAHIEMRLIPNKINYFLTYITPLIKKYKIENEWRKNTTNRCLTCSKETDFINFSTGFKNYCCCECQYNDKSILLKKKKRWKEKTEEEKEKIKKKSKATCLLKYGKEYVTQTDSMKNKSRNTCNSKYGVDRYCKTDKFKKDIKKSRLGKSDNDKQNIIKKSKETCLLRYGVDNVFKLCSTRDKIRKVCLEKYGSPTWLSSQDRINKNYGKAFSEESFNLFKNKLVDLGYLILSYKGALTKNYKKHHFINIEHVKCNSQFTYSRVRLIGLLNKNKPNICPHCYPRDNSISLKEQEIVAFIKHATDNIKIITNTKTVLSSKKELDIYIPEHNFAIEFNGMYWHSEQAGKDKNYHLDKTIECEKLGIHLFHIFESEWDELHKRRIIKYKILNKLKNIKNRIHARKCKVLKLETKKQKRIARKFLDIHHIQGEDKSSIYYGLIYNNKLVSVMSFSASRRNIFGDRDTSNSIELVRFASHLKYNIPGAASRLLKHFERDHVGCSIISYAHRRLTNINSNLYQRLGFKLKKISPPGYYYYDGKKLYHRYNFRKSKLIEMGYDSKLTEFEITDLLGLLRIWDCGQLVYIK